MTVRNADDRSPRQWIPVFAVWRWRGDIWFVVLFGFYLLWGAAFVMMGFLAQARTSRQLPPPARRPVTPRPETGLDLSPQRNPSHSP